MSLLGAIRQAVDIGVKVAADFSGSITITFGGAPVWDPETDTMTNSTATVLEIADAFRFDNRRFASPSQEVGTVFSFPTTRLAGADLGGDAIIVCNGETWAIQKAYPHAVWTTLEVVRA